MTQPPARERKPQLPSLLPVWLKRLLTGSLSLVGFMLADTVFLVLVRLADKVALAPFALGATLGNVTIQLETDGRARRYGLRDDWPGGTVPSLASLLSTFSMLCTSMSR